MPWDLQGRTLLLSSSGGLGKGVTGDFVQATSEPSLKGQVGCTMFLVKEMASTKS